MEAFVNVFEVGVLDVRCSLHRLGACTLPWFHQLGYHYSFLRCDCILPASSSLKAWYLRPFSYLCSVEGGSGGIVESWPGGGGRRQGEDGGVQGAKWGRRVVICEEEEEEAEPRNERISMPWSAAWLAGILLVIRDNKC